MTLVCSIPQLGGFSGVRNRLGGHPGPPSGAYCSSGLTVSRRRPVKRKTGWLKQARSSVAENDVEMHASQEDVGMVKDDANPSPLQDDPQFQLFKELSSVGNLIPVYQRVMADQLTPVVAYRCLVNEHDEDTPSFLLESVINGDKQGRYSFVGTQPIMEILAEGNRVTVLNHQKGTRTVSEEVDPMEVPVRLSNSWRPVPVNVLEGVFTGGWVGYVGYDTVRYAYKGKLPFDSAPEDDRKLPDMQLALYNNVVVFDSVAKIAYIMCWVNTDSFSTLEEAYTHGCTNLEQLSRKLSETVSMPNGSVEMTLSQRPATAVSNMTQEEFTDAIEKTKEYIQDGDIFQMVYSQRFERRTFANAFEIYRALRVVNPSPYMTYLQARGCVLVSSSPEILTRVNEDGTIVNRPLAGTRPRGADEEADKKLEEDLLADEKELSEHVMLVDLGRNDVGKVRNAWKMVKVQLTKQITVAEYGSVSVDKLMEVERYSHVMHISSTVTGKIKPHLNCWDVLRATLPAGTVSGAPKVRAMQIIDELEVNRRGPYGGGLGYVSFSGGMDIALALRTMVVPTSTMDTILKYNSTSVTRQERLVYIQAGAGLVADSEPDKEYDETVNKAAALGRAIDLAESAFVENDV